MHVRGLFQAELGVQTRFRNALNTPHDYVEPAEPPDCALPKKAHFALPRANFVPPAKKQRIPNPSRLRESEAWPCEAVVDRTPDNGPEDRKSVV